MNIQNGICRSGLRCLEQQHQSFCDLVVDWITERIVFFFTLRYYHYNITPTAAESIFIHTCVELKWLNGSLLSFPNTTSGALINSIITPSYGRHWLIVMEKALSALLSLSWCIILAVVGTVEVEEATHLLTLSHLSVSVCLSISEHTIPQPCPTVTAVGNDSRTLARSSFIRSWQCNSSLRTLKCLLI